MNIEILPEDWTRAEKLQAIILSKVRSPHNYTGLKVKDRFQTGYIGEYCVRRMFEQAGLRYQHRIIANGRSNPYCEFTIWRRGQPFTVEVKWASKPSYRRFMFPKAQDWQRSYLYIGGKILNRENAWCAGFLYHWDVGELPTQTFGDHEVESRWCFYESMHPIGALLGMADKAEKKSKNLVDSKLKMSEKAP